MAMDENAMKQMDEAAAEAQAEFQHHVNDWSAKDVIDWWARWYLKAGHKRLGRFLVSIAKKNKKKEE